MFGRGKSLGDIWPIIALVVFVSAALFGGIRMFMAMDMLLHSGWAGDWLWVGAFILAFLSGIALVIGNLRSARRAGQQFGQRQADGSNATGRIPEDVAHDLNNNLAAISGFALLLEMDLGDAPRQRHMLQQIGAAANRGKALIGRIMPFGRVEPAAPAGTGFRLPHDGLHILLVDDDPQAREALELTLQTLGCETAACDSGAEALAIIHDEPDLFDLMITDYLMPNMNGLELAAALRDGGFRKPIVLTSGRIEEIGTAERSQLEIVALLPKPYAWREVGEIVGRVAVLKCSSVAEMAPN